MLLVEFFFKSAANCGQIALLMNYGSSPLAPELHLTGFLVCFDQALISTTWTNLKIESPWQSLSLELELADLV